ncbi:MAG: ion channel [Alphaproteobacteria bacterium]|nr:ion channel [Alphaproteobacteria bacterium]
MKAGALGTLTEYAASYRQRPLLAYFVAYAPVVGLVFLSWLLWNASANGESAIVNLSSIAFNLYFNLINIILICYMSIGLWRRYISSIHAVISTIIFAVFSVVNHTFIYMIGGLCVNRTARALPVLCPGGENAIEPSMSEAFFMSLTMMTSLGFGAYTPSPRVEVFAAVQSLVGFFFLAFVAGLVLARWAERKGLGNTRIVVLSKASRSSSGVPERDRDNWYQGAD